MLYVVVLKLDLALFTVYPTIGVVLLGTHLRDRLQGKPQSRSKRQYDDDDEFVTTGDVAALLYEVELHREKISDRLAMLRLWLHKYPELNKHFTQFEAKGGIFAASSFSSSPVGCHRAK